MKNFVDFIVDVAKEKTMGEEFGNLVEKADHKEISSWLKGKGYDVNEDDCKKLLENKDDIKSTKVGFFY